MQIITYQLASTTQAADNGNRSSYTPVTDQRETTDDTITDSQSQQLSLVCPVSNQNSRLLVFAML